MAAPDAAALRLGCIHLVVPDALRADLAARVDAGDLVISLRDFSGELRLVSACHATVQRGAAPVSASDADEEVREEEDDADDVEDVDADTVLNEAEVGSDADALPNGGVQEARTQAPALWPVYASPPPARLGGSVPHYLDGDDQFSDAANDGARRNSDDDVDDDDDDFWRAASDNPRLSPASLPTPRAPASPPSPAMSCPESGGGGGGRGGCLSPGPVPPLSLHASKGGGDAAVQKRPRDDCWDEEDDGEDWALGGGCGLPGAAVTADRGINSGKRVRFTDGDAASASKAVDSSAPWSPVVVAGTTAVPARWGATLTRLSDKDALLVGGESDDVGLFRDMHTLRLDAGVWSAGLVGCVPGAGGAAAMPRATALPQPRAWHTATRVGDRVFVFGGEVADGAADRRQVADMVSLDLLYSSCVEVRPVSKVAPPPRAGHAACRLDESIFVFGGIGGPGGSKWLSDSYVFDTSTLEWTKCKPRSSAPRPSARSYASLTVLDENIVLFGGNNQSRSFGDVFLGSIQRKEKNGVVTGVAWREPLILGSAAPAPRTGHCAVASADGKSLLMYGGWDDMGLTKLWFADVWELNFVSATEARWRLVHAGVQNNPPPSQPGKRAGAAMCEAGEGADAAPVLVGGFRDFGQLSDAFRFETAKCSARKMPHPQYP